MNKGTVVALLLVVLGGGYGLGRLATRDKDSSNSAAATAMPTTQGPSDGVDRVRVALEGPERGPADAPVTIVEFSDFQCPFCSRVVPTVDKIMKDYPKRSGSSSATTRCRSTTRRRWPPRPASPPRRRGSSGRCTTRCSPTSRRWTGRPREGRPGDRPRHEQVQDRARHPLGQGARRRRPGGRQADWRAGDAELLHRRAQRAGRAAVRGVQEGHRRRDRARQEADRQGDGAGDRCMRRS